MLDGVLPASVFFVQELRSSPTLVGRCWLLAEVKVSMSFDKLRSSPTLVGRCWLLAEVKVSMSFDKLRSSPTLVGRCSDGPIPVMNRDGVAILTDPGGPVLAAGTAFVTPVTVFELRSSPTLVGRCWLDPAVEAGAVTVLVAILTDPGGPVLGSTTDEGSYGTRRCDPHRPWWAGAGRCARSSRAT